MFLFKSWASNVFKNTLLNTMCVTAPNSMYANTTFTTPHMYIIGERLIRSRIHFIQSKLYYCVLCAYKHKYQNVWYYHSIGPLQQTKRKTKFYFVIKTNKIELKM